MQLRRHAPLSAVLPHPSLAVPTTEFTGINRRLLLHIISQPGLVLSKSTEHSAIHRDFIEQSSGDGRNAASNTVAGTESLCELCIVSVAVVKHKSLHRREQDSTACDMRAVLSPW